MTLNGVTVTVCRTEDQAAPVLERLADLGAEPLHLPLFEVVPPVDGGAALRRALGDHYDWLVFTSTNAVRAVARALDQLDRPGELPGRVAAVGTATARALTEHGWPPAHVAARATAAHLGADLPDSEGRRCLAPLAELAGDDLRQTLDDRGFTVTTVEAYRLAEKNDFPSALLSRAAAADAILVTSPSTAARFEQVAAGRWPETIVSIGPQTSRRLANLGHPATAEADPHNVDGLIDALVNTLAP